MSKTITVSKRVLKRVNEGYKNVFIIPCDYQGEDAAKFYRKHEELIPYKCGDRITVTDNKNFELADVTSVYVFPVQSIPAIFFEDMDFGTTQPIGEIGIDPECKEWEKQARGTLEGLWNSYITINYNREWDALNYRANPLVYVIDACSALPF